MVFLGIDLHSNCFACCFLHEDGGSDTMTFSLTPLELGEFYKRLTPETYVMIEASTNTFQFADLIRSRVQQVFVANPHKLKLISMVKRKTDKIDAEKLAIYLKMQVVSGEELVKPVYVPDETIRDLRSLFTTYRLLRRQTGGVKNRIHSLFKQHLLPFTREYIFGKARRRKLRTIAQDDILNFQLALLFDELEYLEKRIAEVKEQLYRTAACYYKEIDILTSMKGISVLTAIALIADIATVTRFPNAKTFASYLRSAPGVDASNETQRPLGTNKQGRKLSVTLLSQSLNHFRDGNPKIHTWYDKLVNKNRKRVGIVRMAICRRVFTELYQMLKKEEYHWYRDEKNHTWKMEQYRHFLEKNNLYKQGGTKSA
jgi:transposase